MAMKYKEFHRNPGNDAFLYCRYSSDAQKEESIDQQIEKAQEFADKNGYKIIKTYEDRAITGTTLERPGLQTLLYDAKIYRPAYLLIWKLNRLSREVHDSFALDQLLMDFGVEIVTIGEALPREFSMRYIMFGMHSVMNQEYIIQHREDVMRGLNFNAEHCLYNGVKILGYTGRPRMKYELDPETAPVVQRIYKEYAEGKPLQQIANELNDAGIKTAKGNKFVVNSLRHILTNRTYLGEYKWGDSVTPGGFPRLVSDELFETVAKRLEANKRGGKANIRKIHPESSIEDYWLTGHLFCGECESSMQGVSAKSHTGKIYFYYSCKDKRKHKCKLKDVRKEIIEEIVRKTLEDILMDPANRITYAQKCFQYYMSMNADTSNFEGSLKASIKEIDRRLNNIMKAIQDGIYNDMTQQTMLELQSQKEFMEEQLKKEQLRKKYQLDVKDIVRYFDSFVGNLDDTGVRQRILDTFVDKVIVYSDKLVITMHYEDDRRELPIKDTIELINGRKRIVEMIDNHDGHDTISKELLQSMFVGSGNGDTGGSDFF